MATPRLTPRQPAAPIVAPDAGSAVLPELIARQCAATPHAVALLAEDETVTYGELDARANQLGNALRARGVNRNSVVGVCGRRRIELVVALLGIWRAGGCYLPLDPDHPMARVRAIVDAAGVDLVVDEVGRGPDFWGEQVEATSVATTLDQATTAPAGRIEPGDAAYVLFTSGSTGTPKGVVIEHAGIANNVLWRVAVHGLGPTDRVLQKTPIVFDAAGWELFAPLVCGGTVVLAPDAASGDPRALVGAVAEHDITVLQVVPSMLRMLPDQPGWPACTTLRVLTSGGEPLSAELCRRALDRLGTTEVRMLNTYGPTECSIDVTAHLVDPTQHHGGIPIGRPITNVRVCVLDEDGDLSPVGAVGELHIGGVALARGYLGRAAETAARFVPDPYGPPGSRLFASGDQVRWNHHGLLEFVGRRDAQVKVNGVRIEPGEVEAALNTYPGVAEAAVRAVADDTGVHRLVGYFVGRDAQVSAVELRRFLRDRLPGYLVPSVFVPVVALPRTVSGKLDRKALPAPVFGARTPAAEVPPSRTQARVSAIWRDLLDAEDVAVTDDFFQRGGHSLLLTQLAHALAELAGHPIAVSDLFAASTVAEQAALIDLEPVRAAGSEPIEALPVAVDAPLSYGQERFWVLDQLDPTGTEYLVPVLVRLPREVSPDTVANALTMVAQRHEPLRTRIEVGADGPRAVLDPPAPVPLRVSDTRTLAEELAATLRIPIDLGTGPAWRAVLVTSEMDEQILLLTIHHAACDGVSVVVLDEELRALCADPLCDLPALPIRYADYATWQREQVRAGGFAGQLAHWRAALAGIPALAVRPDRERASLRDTVGAVVTFDLPAATANALVDVGRAHRATPFMTLLTVWTALLTRYSGQRDFGVGVPVAGRDRPETAGLVGAFLNTLVLRTPMDPAAGFATALAATRQTCQAAFANQDVPFNLVAAEVDAEHDPSRTPLFQTMFDLLDEGITGHAPTASDLDALRKAWGAASTDLTLMMWRRPDGGFGGALEYASALYDRSTAEAMARHFAVLAASCAADPDQCLDELVLLSPAEQESLTSIESRRWPGTESSIVDILAERVAATPDAVAVTCADESISYAEFDLAADRLAASLREHGVGVEDVVAVALPRDIGALVALFGVLKAGAAYLPIDPTNPPDRIAGLIQDAGPALVLAATETIQRCGQVENPRWHDPVAATMAEEVVAARAVEPRSAAYVLYTSGSTGVPKGVVVEHRSLVNLYHNYLNGILPNAVAAAGGRRLRVALTAALTFDAIWEPVLWMLAGHELLLVRDDMRMLPAATAAHIAERRVDMIEVTPAYCRELVAAGLLDDDRHRPSTICLVGEKIDAPLWNRIRTTPGTFASNGYGPTETTVIATWCPVLPDRPLAVIGRPLVNTGGYVLGENLRPVPPGQPGELYLSGVQVARCYLGDPAATAEKFLPDPYGPPGGRMYRSGDLVRRRPDGELEYLGRVDRQLKVNGIRIEPGEIEAVLGSHPAVADVLVDVFLGHGGIPSLVAYVRTTAKVSTAQLRDLAARRLPAALVPAAIVEVEQFPLTRTGKVDRAALPAPLTVPLTGHAAKAPSAPPRTPVQERIAAIWSDLLAVPFGVQDNFFAVGGTSLLAARMLWAVQTSFAVEIALASVFDQLTVAHLADRVEALVRADIEALADADLLAGRQAAGEDTARHNEEISR